jgi:mono/diheme cytochrome c family protein
MSQPPAHRGSKAPWAGIVLTLFALAAIVAVPFLAFAGGKAANTTTAPAPPPAHSAPVQPATQNVSPQIAAGAHDFVRFACAQCHGLDGKGGVSPDVPSLTTLAPSLTPAQLTDIINTGRGISDNPTKPFMPVWKGIISDAQIADIVAYLHAGLPAVQDATPTPVPTNQGSAVAGSIDYINFGCINCHGPNGLGGVPNPQSPDTTVPPLSTPDFFSQFNTPKKIQDVIVSGSVLGKHPIVSMPHWGGILTQTEINDLIAYINTLKRPNNGTTTYKAAP